MYYELFFNTSVVNSPTKCPTNSELIGYISRNGLLSLKAAVLDTQR